MVESPTRVVRKASSLMPLPRKGGTPRPGGALGEMVRSGSNRDLALICVSKQAAGRRRLCPLPPALVTYKPPEAPKPAAGVKPGDYVWPGREDKLAREARELEAQALAQELAIKELTKAVGLEAYIWPGAQQEAEKPKEAPSNPMEEYSWPGQGSRGAGLGVETVAEEGSQEEGVQGGPVRGKKVIPESVGHPATVLEKRKEVRRASSRQLIAVGSKSNLLEPPNLLEPSNLLARQNSGSSLKSDHI